MSQEQTELDPLQILQQKFKKSQTGGKGSVRRKKIPTKKVKTSQESEVALEVLQLPVSLQALATEKVVTQDLEVCNSYLKAFTLEFTSVINKAFRKSNRPTVDHYTTIRSRLTEYLQLQKLEDQAIGFHENLGNYCVKNLSEKALGEVAKLFQLCHEVIDTGEYRGFQENSVPSEDSQLHKLYDNLELDFSVRMTPTSLRNHYQSKLDKVEINQTEKGDDMRNAYFSIIKLLLQYQNQTN